jgi:hypothetical protein
MTWRPLPIVHGHAPDLERTDPASFLINGAVPLTDAIGPDYAFDQPGPQLNGQPLGGVETVNTVGVRRIFLGTASKIYEWNGASTLTDRSPTGDNASVYAASTAATWSFASFGNTVLAVNPNNRVQRLTYSGASFADASTDAPFGSIIVNFGFPASPQLLVANYTKGGFSYPDGWYTSALATDTIWTGGYDAGQASGQLLEPVGKITAGIAWRDGVLLFKSNAMYYGEYNPDGGNVVHQWRRLSSSIGCIGKNAVVCADDAVYFANANGFYRFDGSYPQRLPGYVHEDWARRLAYAIANTSYTPDHVYATYQNDAEPIIRFSLPAFSDNEAAIWYYFNPRSGRWTSYMPTTLAIRTMGFAGFKYGATGTGYCLKRGTTNLSCTVDIPIIGGPDANYTIRNVWPMWKAGAVVNGTARGPNTATWASAATLYAYTAPEATATTTVTATASTKGKVDGQAAGQWVSGRMVINLTAPWEFGTVQVNLIASGKDP